MKMHITKVIGRAGTGKTHYLINELSRVFNDGISPSNVGMISHTKAAVGEFKSRSINKFGFDHNEFKYFRTMHSMCYSLLGLKEENQAGRKALNEFINTYYPNRFEITQKIDENIYALTSRDKERLRGDPELNAMIAVDNTIRNTMIEEFNFGELYKRTGNDLSYIGYIMTGSTWDKKLQKLRINWSSKTYYISPSEQKKFSLAWRQYMQDNDIYDFTRMLEEVFNGKITVPVDYMFIDEFQDFTTLQYQIYLMWRDYGNIDKIWIAGDDAQSIYRWAGGSASYFIETECNDKKILPNTYRHGNTILRNSYKYIDLMYKKEIADITPAKDVPGDVIKTYEDGFLKYIDYINDPNNTVMILSPTDNWSNQVKHTIQYSGKCKSNIVSLNDTRRVRRIFSMYNTIAALERGESVAWDYDNIADIDADDEYDKYDSLLYGDDIGNSLANEENDDYYTSHGYYQDYMPIKSLLVSSYALPTFTTSEIKNIGNNSKIIQTKTKVKLLKNIKSSIRQGSFNARNKYDKDSFESDFLFSSWDGAELIRNIPDIVLIPNALDDFPAYLPPDITKQAGTIHQAKGREADVVFLVMAVPAPTLKGLHNKDIRDDLMREFYVGATRAKSKIIEIYSYARYSNGEIAYAPLELIR